MSRPRIIKRLGQKPLHNQFGPKGVSNTNFVHLNLEEYETIRLIDKESNNQEECAAYMGVARSTVQKIYSEARIKIANAIINGDTLIIEDHDYLIK